MPEQKWLNEHISFIFLSADDKRGSVWESTDSFLASADGGSAPGECVIHSFSEKPKRKRPGVSFERVFPHATSSGELILDYTERINALFFDLLKREMRKPFRAWCICYEDISFRKGFIEKILESLNELSPREGSNFILSTYAPRDLAASPELHRGRFYVHYPAGDFFGAHCLVVTSDCLADLRAYHSSVGWNPKIPYDIFINHFARLKDNISFAISCRFHRLFRRLQGFVGTSLWIILRWWWHASMALVT